MACEFNSLVHLGVHNFVFIKMFAPCENGMIIAKVILYYFF